jgi:hypothetical protein
MAVGYICRQFESHTVDTRQTYNDVGILEPSLSVAMDIGRPQLKHRRTRALLDSSKSRVMELD